MLEELEARSGGLGYITSRKYIYQVLRALDFIHSHDVSVGQQINSFCWGGGLFFSFSLKLSVACSFLHSCRSSIAILSRKMFLYHGWAS